MKLNLGCGGHRAPEPWINVDRSMGSRGFPCHPDLIADIRSLPLADQTVDAIYAGHVLEHLEYDTVVFTLTEWRRVLKPGAPWVVVGPDMDRAVDQYAEYAPCIWPGLDGEWSEWPGAKHQYCPTAANTLPLLAEVFPATTEVPIGDLDPSVWPVTDQTPWQFAFTGSRR